MWIPGLHGTKPVNWGLIADYSNLPEYFLHRITSENVRTAGSFSRLVCFFPESTWESYFRVKTKVADRYAYMTLVKVNWTRTNLYDDDNVFAVPQRPPKPSSDIKRPPPRPQEGVVNLPPQKTNKVKNLSSMFGGQVCVFLVSQQSTKIMRPVVKLGNYNMHVI